MFVNQRLERYSKERKKTRKKENLEEQEEETLEKTRRFWKTNKIEIEIRFKAKLLGLGLDL